MITRLGRLCAGRVGVVARTSSRLIQRRTFRIRDIGRALRVDYVVEGSVRFNGSRGRITIRLIETQGETQLWAESYERQLADCFQVQAEMATEIAQSLALELLPPAASVPQIGTGSAEAYQAYLKGRYHWNRPEDEGCLQAIACFEEAISLDSRFASAHSALAMVYAGAVRYERVEPRPALVRARDAALRALELDPADAEAHLTLGEVERILEWNWARAEKAYRMALACNPSNERAHRLYGLYLAMRGRPADAAVEADRAYDLDPLCLVVNTSAAMVRYLTRDPHAAIARCRRTLDMDSAFAPARGLLAAGLIAAGCLDEAACELDALAVGPLEPSSLAWLAHGRAATGEVARASVIVERLEALTRQRYVSAYLRAIAHLAVGDANGAIALLGQASEQRDPALTTLAVDPRLDTLSGDSRYRALVDRLALDK